MAVTDPLSRTRVLKIKHIGQCPEYDFVGNRLTFDVAGCYREIGMPIVASYLSLATSVIPYRIVMNLAFSQSVMLLSHYLALWIQSHIFIFTPCYRTAYVRLLMKQRTWGGEVLFGSWTSSPLRCINSQVLVINSGPPNTTLHCTTVTECGGVNLRKNSGIGYSVSGCNGFVCR